ncbi:MAG: carboxypeptidase-like regulatory domain-containing protein [Myxococcota bacterium]
MARLLPVFLLFVFAGCSFVIDEPTLRNECNGDSDCETGTCDLMMRACITETVAPMAVSIEVTPPEPDTGRTVIAQPFDLFSISGTLQQDLQVKGAISVIGLVTHPNFETAVPANVYFRAPHPVDGADDLVYQGESDDALTEAADRNDASYVVRVVRNTTYDVWVEPTGEAASQLPPFNFGGVTVPETGEFTRVDIAFPTEFETLEARLVDDNESGVAGLEVRAFERETGRQVSSAVVSDAEGNFDLHLLPGADFFLQIESTEENSFVPTLAQDPANLFVSGANRPEILIPSLLPVLYRGRVDSESRSNARIEGARVTFRSTSVLEEDTNIAGSFQATTFTDANGDFEIDVLPGMYDIVVTPPVDEPRLGVRLTEGIMIRKPRDSNVLQGQSFEVPDRVAVGGTVRGDRRQMTNVEVRADALPELALVDMPASQFNRDGDALTDASGLFTIPLDVGRYDLSVRPDPESGFPWVVRSGFAVQQNSRVIQMDFTASAPVIMRGRVTDAGNQTLPGAMVRAWVMAEGAEGTMRRVLAGEVEADEEGSYTLLLPPQLPPQQ